MIYIASDHAGFQLKKHLLKFVSEKLGLQIKDMGPAKFNETDDFPDYAVPLAEEVAKKEGDLGILICGSGHGMCIAANKVKGAAAIVGYSITGAELARKHNNANILCLAGRVLTEDHASAITKKFLETEFDGDERFVRRIRKIAALEK